VFVVNITPLKSPPALLLILFFCVFIIQYRNQTLLSLSMDVSFYFTYTAYYFECQLRNTVTLACESWVVYPCGTTNSEIKQYVNPCPANVENMVNS